MIKDYGFIEPEITPEDYILGSSLPLEVINPTSNWEDSLPVYEPQASKYETFGCTCWGTLNQIETYFKYIWGFEPNYSDRFTYINAGVKLGGAPPSKAYESIRKQGVIDQDLLPYPDTYEEFTQPNPMLSGYLNNGQQWLKRYDFKHEWVDNPNPETIKEALKYSPVGISVTAWIEENGLYVDKGQRNTHWCLAYKVEDGKIHVFDSYDNSKKVLHPDHKTKYAKRILITKKQTVKPKPLSWFEKRFMWYNIFNIWKIGNKHHD